MSLVPNPWLPNTQASVLPTEPTSVPATGPTLPQHGVPAPDAADQLPTRHPTRSAALYVLAAHGGAGASTIASLWNDWAPIEAWPAACTDMARVVVVARTNARGLCAAKNAARQWASGLVAEVQVVGLALLADAPGRLPAELRALAKVVAGGYPRTWTIPWMPDWRLGEAPSLGRSPREVHRLVNDLKTLTRTGGERNNINRKDKTDGAA